MAELMPAGNQQTIDTLEVRQRLWQVAGTHFRGRKQELAQLQAFAEDMGSVFERATDVLLRRGSSFTLAINGPGGVGKSALLARFMLERAKVHRLLFAYLDFADPRINADEPLTLLAETMRQLGIEYPDVRESCERSRAAWLQQTATDDATLEARSARLVKLRAEAIRDVAMTLRRVTNGKQRIVFALDSFETAQSRGEAVVQQLWQTLDALHAHLTSLCFIIAGRDPIDRPGMKTLRLSTFDSESAVAYLQTYRIHEDRARELFQCFGGSPLALQAAIATCESEQPELGELLHTLYRKMLGHIHDADLLQLAQLAMVLRRVTPELILEVLAPACGVSVDSLERAQALFAELATDIHLFEVGADGLCLRRSLRHLILAPVREAAQEDARRVDAAAVHFYSSKDGERERAEEIYHRLWLDQPAAAINARWREDVACHLVSALVELDAPRRELLTERICMPLYDDAGSVTSDAERQAVHALEAELQSASPAQQTALTLQRAHLVIKFELAESARAAAEDLLRIEATSLAAGDRLQSVAQRSCLAQLHPDARALAPEPLLLLSLTEPAVLAESPHAACWAAAAPGSDAKARVLRVLNTGAIAAIPEAPLRTFALTLAALDTLFSQSTGAEPGVLAVVSRVPRQGDVIQTWRAFVLNGSRQEVQKSIGEALRSLPKADALITAVQRLFCESLDIRLRTAPAATPLSDAAEVQEIVEAILTSFTVEELQALLNAQLQRRLETSPVETPAAPSATPPKALAALVTTARTEGWLPRLLAVLLEAHSKDQQLASIASRFGAYSLAGDASLRRQLDGFVDYSVPAAFRDNSWQLARIERGVCRVESTAGVLVATGFLVAADLVLTSSLGTLHPEELQVRFDRQVDATGRELSAGTLLRLEDQPVASGGAELPFALLRLRTVQGEPPAGNSHTAKAWDSRSLLHQEMLYAHLAVGKSVAVAYHTGERSLQLAIGTCTSLDPPVCNIALESSCPGGPCFEPRMLQLMGLHVSGTRAGEIRVLELSEIIASLRQQGVELVREIVFR